ncbi:MAG: two-component sensor histidine kinase [Planctomycetes bacterium]|nr:two-component sensor histidine kinase [Planctomycetota bacterium]
MKSKPPIYRSDASDGMERRRLLETGGPRPSPPPPGYRGTRLAFLGAIAGGFAHEIKNPLSTMAINLALIREDWQNPQTAKEQRLLRKTELLEREVKRLEEIVQTFLSFARGDHFRFELLDLNDIIREVLEFTDAENQNSRVRVLADLRSDLPQLSLDRNHLKQAILNLISNARQAMPNGGELLIRTWREGDSITLEITDTGVGMSPEVRERCWELFFSTRKGGTGYGLPLTKRILEEHGGSIGVWSEAGRGTRFTLRFPIPESTREPEPEPETPPPAAVVETTFTEVPEKKSKSKKKHAQ